ncbi:MAG TPA: DinB family protein [Acidobacteriaceae bacterium]|nr:DinB family protein [Acidobacteriaceae bacterium]
MSTTTATPAAAAELEILREQAKTIHGALRRNTEGLTQEESLISPHAGGNCLNWVLGHLLHTYDGVILPLVGEAPVLGKSALKRYERGTPALHEAAEALPLPDLLTAWDEASRRVDAGLARLTAERLDQPAPFSPRNNPKETVRSLLTIVLFHQAYHVGQTGVLRRIAGREGAIR